MKAPRGMFRNTAFTALAAAWAVAMVGCIATHPASPPTPAPPAQTLPAEGPFVRVGTPIVIAPDYPICLSSDGRAMLSVESRPKNEDASAARVWDLDAVRPASKPLPLGWLDYGLSADGKVAFTTDHKAVRAWDVATSRLLWEAPLDQSEPGGVAISPDGKDVLAFSHGDKSVKVWRVGGDRPRLSIPCDDDWPTIDFDPTGTRIVIFADSLLHFYDAQTGRELFPAFMPYETSYGIGPQSIRRYFDPTGRRFLQLADEGATVMDTSTGKTIVTLTSHAFRKGVSWSADGQKIILVVPFEAVEVRDAATGRLEQTITGHDVFGLSILPGGRWAICRRWDDPLEVWDLTSGQKVQTLDGAFYCDPSPTGTTLVTHDKIGNVIVWKLR